MLVVPDNSSHDLSVALRIAHDLHKFHGLQAEIIIDEPGKSISMSNGNAVLIGAASSLAGWTLRRTSSTVMVQNGEFVLGQCNITGGSLGEYASVHRRSCVMTESRCYFLEQTSIKS